jgi:hypothetical protein
MLFLAGLDGKSYWTRLSQGIPGVSCPDAECRGVQLRAHGWYPRYLGGQRVAFRRLRCPRCGVTHALLPADVCAYQDLTLPVVERAVVETRAGPTAAARAVGMDAAAAVRRVRRWLASPVWEQLRQLLPAAGELGQRIVAVLGAGAEKLLRLRAWLWSQRGLLLGGPTGLFRRGRPAERLRPRST